MDKNLVKLRKDRDDWVLLSKKEVSKLYKDGYGLGEICRRVKLDISTVLVLLKLHKFKKKKLYEVYTNQSTRTRASHAGLILKRDEYYLEKFFPNSNSIFSTNYYWFWREKTKKREKKQGLCKHKIRHIRCSLCEKILGDATDIPLNNNLISPKQNHTIGEKEAF